MFVLFYAMLNAQIIKPVINIEPLCFTLHLFYIRTVALMKYQKCKQKAVVFFLISSNSTCPPNTKFRTQMESCVYFRFFF